MTQSNKKQPERVLQGIAAKPWLVSPEHMQTILTVAQREGDLEVAQAMRDERLEGTERVQMVGGVAVIDIVGTIFPRANLFTEFSGGVSLDRLAADFIAARDNPDVKAIVLNIDSPGGYSAGISEFADLVFASRKAKPITAYVFGDGASAAYWIATAAEKLYINDTAVVGSIGTVVAIPDDREAEAREGRTTYQIVSTQSPKKRPDPATDSGRAQIQATLDAMTDVFIERVARFRGVAQKTVRADFGQGDVLVGANAVRVGMADGLSTLGEVVAGLQSNTRTGKNQMAENQQAQPAITAEGLKESFPDVYQSVRISGVLEGEADERARIQSCLQAAGIEISAELQRVIFEDLAGEPDVKAHLWEAHQNAIAKAKADRAGDAAELDQIGTEAEKSENAEDESGDRIAAQINAARGYE